MSQRILQVNFRFTGSKAEYERNASGLAADFAAVPGCAWKIWLMNENDHEAGGIYLFDDDAALQTMLRSQLIAGVLSNPSLSDFTVKQFDVLEDVTRTTRGPIEHPVSTAPRRATA